MEKSFITRRRGGGRGRHVYRRWGTKTLKFCINILRCCSVLIFIQVLRWSVPPPLILHLPTSNSLSREGGVHCPPLSLQRWHDVPPLQWKGKVPFRIFLLLNEEGSTLLYTFFPLYLGKVLPPPPSCLSSTLGVKKYLFILVFQVTYNVLMKQI